MSMPPLSIRVTPEDRQKLNMIAEKYGLYPKDIIQFGIFTFISNLKVKTESEKSYLVQYHSIQKTAKARELYAYSNFIKTLVGLLQDPFVSPKEIYKFNKDFCSKFLSIKGIDRKRWQQLKKITQKQMQIAKLNFIQHPVHKFHLNEQQFFKRMYQDRFETRK